MDSRFLGPVGERVEVSGQVLSAEFTPTQWGMSTDIRLLCLDGSHVRWESSSQHFLDPGDTIVVRGTVVRYAHRDGVEYAELTRGRVTETAGALF